MVPKFRGWHKELEQMIYGKEVCGHIEYTTNLIDALNTMLNEDDYDIEVMQSTGLKDKNGVDIFEGDVVSVRNHPFQKTEKSGAGIEIDGDYAISWKEGDLTWCAGNLLLARLKPYVTIAGNVWENPELLEQANES